VAALFSKFCENEIRWAEAAKAIRHNWKMPAAYVSVTLMVVFVIDLLHSLGDTIQMFTYYLLDGGPLWLGY
jgi:hypothetical protein